MKQVLIILVLLSLNFSLHAQLANGPNDPTVAATNTSVGSNAFASQTLVYSSDDSWATCNTKGYTNYLVTSGYGFSIHNTANILGIQVDVERKATNRQDVALLDGWANAKVTPSFQETDATVTTNAISKTVSAGNNRMLIAVLAMENGLSLPARDLTALSYGGQAMTQLTQYTETSGASGFTAKVEVWYLMEAGLAAASSSNFSFTFNTYSVAQLSEYTDMFSAASFINVDQLSPIYHNSETSAENVASLNLPSLNTLAGNMTVIASMAGHNPGSAVDGGTNNVSITTGGYTEGTDVYFSNNDFRNSGSTCCETSGAIMMTAQKSSTATGTETPTIDYGGTANRQVNIGVNLRRARNLDYSVRLKKSSGFVGSNYAKTSDDWPTTDTYVTYGGNSDLWGTTWTPADINSADFGAAISVFVQNLGVEIDHIRITVYTDIILPVRMSSVYAEIENADVLLTWQTASEKNNDYFTVERSSDGEIWELLETVDGADNSYSMVHYQVKDHNPPSGMIYYRVVQTDHDGTVYYSEVVAVNSETDSGKLSVYPNPASNTIYLSGSRNYPEYCIYNSTGQEVLRLPGNTTSINVSGLSPGIYLLLVKDGAITYKETIIISR